MNEKEVMAAVVLGFIIGILTMSILTFFQMQMHRDLDNTVMDKWNESIQSNKECIATLDSCGNTLDESIQSNKKCMYTLDTCTDVVIECNKLANAVRDSIGGDNK